jgi:diguanylate cyclase (GGDEF)-like protein
MQIHQNSKSLGILSAVALAFAITMSVLTLVGIAGLRQRQLASRELTDVRFLQRDALMAIVNEETGVRGYVATGVPRFLEVYYAGRRDLASDLHDIGQDENIDRAIRQTVASTNGGRDGLQRYFGSQIALVRLGNIETARRRLTPGKLLMDRYRQDDRRVSDRIAARLAALRAAIYSMLDLAAALAELTIFVFICIGLGFVRLIVLGARLERYALRDSVTRMGNRRAFFQELNRRTKKDPVKRPFGVVMVDLDGFKLVNDRLGHAAGDEVLRMVAARLMDAMRDVDFAARVGGDEFAIVLDGLIAADKAQRVAERLERALSRPYALKSGSTATIGASLGTSLYPADAKEVAGLMALADKRMYEAKQRRVKPARPALAVL